MELNERLEEVYGLGYKVQSFAVANPFCIEMNKASYKLGKQLQAFSFFCGDIQKTAGVLDMSLVNAMVDGSKTVLEEVARYRAQVYERSYNTKIDFDEKSNNRQKYLFMDYMLSNSICYIEKPKYVTKDGIPQQTYDKFLVTKNPAIMGAWMGMSTEEMQIKYGSKVANSVYELSNGEVRFVKCMTSGKGNSISVPRSSFKCDDITTCVPLFMLYAFLKGLEEYYTQGILKFTYLKDNNTIRELFTTTSSAILMDYYKDENYVNMVLGGTDISSNQQGGMALSSKQSRGYIKVPELGLSRYDATGVRALNLARILRVERVSEVDRSFIDVDLDSCVDNFYNCLDYIVAHMPDKLPIVLQQLLGDDGKMPEDTSAVSLLSEIHKFVDMRNVLLSTTFHKALHKYMISNPQLFPYYTGLPCIRSSAGDSSGFNVEEMEGF